MLYSFIRVIKNDIVELKSGKLYIDVSIFPIRFDHIKYYATLAYSNFHFKYIVIQLSCTLTMLNNNFEII